MRPRATHIILVAAALTALTILAAHATTPILYSAENISTDSHADPVTIDKRSPGDAASVIPLMDDLLGQTGTLTLTIKLQGLRERRARPRPLRRTLKPLRPARHHPGHL
ncbi:MAG: hypothetical protein RQM90_14410 [Methanoculleus sp.]